MKFHLTPMGDIEACVNRDQCSASSGHFETPQAAVERRNILAGTGRLTN